MARLREYRTFMGDFETTVFEGQEDTEVWASAVVEFNTEDVQIFNSLPETFSYLLSLETNVIIYYHNLKFDGAFWLDYLIQHTDFIQAVQPTGDKTYDLDFVPNWEMENKTFKYSISDMGQWYSITIKYHDKFIIIRDSLKLLPFSVKKIGKAFNTKHKKLEMEYEGFRYAGCEITDEEKEYIANDVLVVKEALEIMFKQGHNKTTIGACCLEEYKHTLTKAQWNKYFPDLRNYWIPEETFGCNNAEEYIRHSYKGGWCYVVKGKENQIYHNGTTADVNSLYPSMMSAESGNKYPVGDPIFWNGNYIPDEALKPDKYYFIRIRTRFQLKPNKLPCIQIKGNIRYRGTEWLETSDYYFKGKYVKELINFKGELEQARPILTLTMTDYQLIQEHYDLTDFEILDGCYFRAREALFDDYIEKYRKIKMESKGALRELAKLFLNNLYGKMATSPENYFKYAYVKDDDTIGFVDIHGEDKEPIYIPIGAAITSYARNFTIRTAQANYYGIDNRGFIYADTDSIHCDLLPEELKNVPVDEVKFCHWKLEANWDEAIFTRQKTYIEHITHENLKPVEPYYSIKCAGMPETCKKLFQYSMNGIDKESSEYKKLNEKAKEFVDVKRTIKDFTLGLKIPGKLLPKRIRGGIILKETTYEMR